MNRAAAVAVFFGLVACKGDATRDAGTHQTIPTSGTAASASSGVTTGRAATSTWAGTYSSAPGSLYVVDGGEWAGVKWRGDDASAGQGEGRLTVTVDAETARVSGDADGAIGDALLTGTLVEGEVTARVVRKDPTDRGLTGTLVAKETGETLTGTMRLSPADARIIREVKFALSRRAP